MVVRCSCEIGEIELLELLLEAQKVFDIFKDKYRYDTDKYRVTKLPDGYRVVRRFNI